jgi:hypothetical protein
MGGFMTRKELDEHLNIIKAHSLGKGQKTLICLTINFKT